MHPHRSPSPTVFHRTPHRTPCPPQHLPNSVLEPPKPLTNPMRKPSLGSPLYNSISMGTRLSTMMTTNKLPSSYPICPKAPPLPGLPPTDKWPFLERLSSSAPTPTSSLSSMMPLNTMILSETPSTGSPPSE
jgi:hypothetical protein